MLKLTRKRRFRIPTSLAVVAAIALVATSVVGKQYTDQLQPTAGRGLAASTAAPAEPAPVHVQSTRKSARGKHFSFSLFLIRPR